MKRRIIINIFDDALSDELAVNIVQQVIEKGRVSESRGHKHYCHICTTSGGSIVHAMKRTANTDTFLIFKDKNKPA